MQEASSARILAELGDGDLVLDVGGGVKPFTRADWVLDLLPYETRGEQGYDGGGPDRERFSAATWAQRDICDRAPWPFTDDQFDFAICSHTLEDVRDPIWVCAELQRVARAGYVEVPSRLEEQSYGIQGPWVGWGHHHWLIDVVDGGLEFVFKSHVIARDDSHFPAGFGSALTAEQRVSSFWWEGSLPARERIFVDWQDFDAYLQEYVARHLGALPERDAGPELPKGGGRLGRLRNN